MPHRGPTSFTYAGSLDTPKVSINTSFRDTSPRVSFKQKSNRRTQKKAKRPKKAKRDHVCIQIDQMLSNSSQVPSQLPSIFRVHHTLRNENEDAYEPKIISIGPYHQGKPRLKPMETHKTRFLKQLLNRKSAGSLDKYVRAMRKLEERARKCYADPIDRRIDSSDQFVKMMLLDSCFIVELFRKIREKKTDDPIFLMDHVVSGILRDLKLLENQLPLFVLVRFMKLTNDKQEDDGEEEDEEDDDDGEEKDEDEDDEYEDEEEDDDGEEEEDDDGEEEEDDDGEEEDETEGAAEGQEDGVEDIIDMAFHALHIGRDHYQKPPYVSPKDIKHLLDLFHQCWCSYICPRANVYSKNFEYIKSATELTEAGVQFNCAKEWSINGQKMFNVGFENGVLEVPRLEIDDLTEAIVRNLIAYEQYLPNPCERPVTDYYVLLDNLVNSSKDVEILRHHGIIHHSLGDDGVVSAMINKLTNHVCRSEFFSYIYVFYDVNAHCKQRWNVWMANLKHTYFNTPWAWISFFAAVILLLLTLLQTITSVLSIAPKS